MYDIGIIGAGPAGTTLARLLGDRFRILLLDSGRRKCCGGILAPEAQKMLARFDLAVPKTILVDPQPFSVAVLDMPSGLIRHYARQYVNIDRSAFDRWLLSLVPGSVDVRSNAVYRRSESSPENETTTIHFTEKGERRTEGVRLLVGADGAFSTVRRSCFPNTTFPKKYLSLQDWYETGQVDAISDAVDFWNDYVGIFDPEFTDFYAWTIPKNGGLIFGGATPCFNHSRKHFEMLKIRLESFGLKLHRPHRREAGQLLRPVSVSSICLGSQRVALLGEAAGLISPSSAEGISFALAGALMLSRSFSDAKRFQFDRYRRQIRSLVWSIRLKNLKSPGMFNPWLRRQIMLSGLTTLNR